MPFLNIHASREIDADAGARFLADASRLVVTHLGKPESVMMTALQRPLAMTLGGDDGPAAMIELSVLDLDTAAVPALYEALQDLATRALDLPGDRIFINFHSVPRGQWGWDGRRF